MELVKGDENYTPEWLIKSAKKFFQGSIDFDPFSNYIANSGIVGAINHYGLQAGGQKIDALKKDWPIGVDTWINPPYSRSRIDLAIDLSIEHSKHSNTLILVNSSTSSGWYQSLLKNASCVLFFSKRIEFYNPYDPFRKSGNRYDQSLFLLLPDHYSQHEYMLRFISAFKHFGQICGRV